MNSTVNWPNHRFHRKGSNLLAAVLNLSNFILCPIAAVSRTRGGTRVKKVPRSFIYSPFLGRSSLCASCFAIPPLLPLPPRSFFFHPRRLCNLPTFFTLSFSFFFFSQIGRQLLGQLFLSLSFFRFLTTLARDLTDPIETTRPVAPRRMMNREIV